MSAEMLLPPYEPARNKESALRNAHNGYLGLIGPLLAEFWPTVAVARFVMTPGMRNSFELHQRVPEGRVRLKPPRERDAKATATRRAHEHLFLDDNKQHACINKPRKRMLNA